VNRSKTIFVYYFIEINKFCYFN